MTHHSIIVRLGDTDVSPILLNRADTHLSNIDFLDMHGRLKHGIGQALSDLQQWGLRSSETAVDLALLAAAVTAADTRISRAHESQDKWTREISVYLPVLEPHLWEPLTSLLTTLLNFLTGDRWAIYFRTRPPLEHDLSPQPTQLPLVAPTSICLFSGGLDSFIGAIDLLKEDQAPLLVSHYWDTCTSTYQTKCAEILKARFPTATFQHMRARVGFPTDTVEDGSTEDTLRGRSFLFFALAAMAADAVGGGVDIFVPENGLISLNVPLDPLRVGALSTRTTHPFYMARFDELLHGLGINSRLVNRYAFMTKGEMARKCQDQDVLEQEAANTMSCSSPLNRRFDRDPTEREPKHCGRCVPCLIRRAALHEAFGHDQTPYRIPDLHGEVLDSSKAEVDAVLPEEVIFGSRLN